MILDHIWTQFLGVRLIRESDLYASIYGNSKTKVTFIVEIQFNILSADSGTVVIRTVLGTPVRLCEQKIPAFWNTILTYDHQHYYTALLFESNVTPNKDAYRKFVQTKFRFCLGVSQFTISFLIACILLLEEIDFETGHFRNFWISVTLNLDRVI